MTPVQLELYLGILIGCFIVTYVPFLRKKYLDKSVDEFKYEYVLSALFAFIVSVVAGSALFLANPNPDGFPFLEGLILGVFDNFWVNEVKKLLNM